MLEGRKQVRTPDRFLVQISAVRDPRVAELAPVENISSHGTRVATQRSWEPGSHVEIESTAGELRGRARVVYCQAIGERAFAVGLNLLIPRDDGDTRGELPAAKQPK